MTPTLIVTRPAAQGDRFADRIAQCWDGPLLVIKSPLIEIVPSNVDLAGVNEVIFTSVNGVNATAGLQAGNRAWCVGARTADAAKKAGFDPITGPGDAAALVKSIIKAHPDGTLAHIRGRHARGDIAAKLNAAGLQCRDIVAYDQRALPLSAQARAAVDQGGHVIFPLFSPRTSTILNDAGPFDARTNIVALSQAVADAFNSDDIANVVVASAPNGAAMERAVLKVLADLSRKGR